MDGSSQVGQGLTPGEARWTARARWVGVLPVVKQGGRLEPGGSGSYPGDHFSSHVGLALNVTCEIRSCFS